MLNEGGNNVVAGTVLKTTYVEMLNVPGVVVKSFEYQLKLQVAEFKVNQEGLLFSNVQTGL